MLPLQCRICKNLLHNPVTLPCGFTACHACLPPLQPIAFRQQIHCPFPACARSNIHSADQLSIDVTLQSLTTAWRAACLQQDLHIGTLSSSTSSSSSAHVAVATPAFKDPDTSSEPAPTPNFYQNVTRVMETLRPKIQQETECQVCFLVFDQPLTTSCGHTLCKSCLITSLDHNPNCPLCRRKLPLYMFYHNQPVNKALVRLINFMDRQSAENEIERSSGYATTTTTTTPSVEEQRDLDPNLAMTPLFINSLIFPRMPCYLLVFEPRYRRMLRNVLKTESKVFGMVLPPQQRKQHRFAMDEAVTRWEPSREYGTLLKIVSLELLPDGRALVETVGLSRFQILSPSLTRSELSPPPNTDPVYPRYTTLSSANASTSSQPSRTEEQPLANAKDEKGQEVILGLKDLHNVELELISQKQLMQILQGFVSHMQDRLGPLATQRLEREFGEMIEDDGRSFSFWVGSILPVRPDQKYELLKQISVRQRLQTVLGWIREIEARRSLAVCSIQ
ncbi:MAG: PUA-like domain-containing protein [Linnemannia elongata]|nr:MAG: PUA-like domain-containing protein [Linnemannia elongata]